MATARLQAGVRMLRLRDYQRASLDALAAPDPRDPWGVPAPLANPAAAHRAALCLRPGCLAVVPGVEAALR